MDEEAAKEESENILGVHVAYVKPQIFQVQKYNVYLY